MKSRKFLKLVSLFLGVLTVVKDGHVFADWTPAVPATMPAEDLTIIANYDVASGDNTVAIVFFAAVALAGGAITFAVIKKRKNI